MFTEQDVLQIMSAAICGVTTGKHNQTLLEERNEMMPPILDVDSAFKAAFKFLSRNRRNVKQDHSDGLWYVTFDHSKEALTQVGLC